MIKLLHTNESKNNLPCKIKSLSQISKQHEKSPQSSQSMKEDQLTARGGMQEKQQQYSKLRQAVFPIYGRNEVIKFLLIGSIKFFVILALTLTRDTKDTLVVTQCGAEAIAFLKVSSSIWELMHHLQN